MAKELLTNCFSESFPAPVDSVKHSLSEVVVEGDVWAVQQWLRLCRSPHTLRSYQREASRWLLWAREGVGQDSPALLPHLTSEHAQDFLSHLQQTGLQPASLIQTVKILHGLHATLRELRTRDGSPYSSFNPFALVRRAERTNWDVDGKVLSREAWPWLLEAVESLPRRSQRELRHYHRCRWVVMLLYRTLLRRSEAANLLMGSFACETNEKRWFVRVTGKGGRVGKLAVPDVLLNELQVYRVSCGLGPLPVPGDQTPAIMSINGDRRPVTGQTIYLLMRELAQIAAALCQENAPHLSNELRNLTPHTMRHTGVSHALDAGIPARYVQEQARHASLSTTAIYDHKDRLLFSKAFEAF